MYKELFITTIESSEAENLLLDVDIKPRKRYLLLSHPVDSKIVYYINFNGGHLLLGLNEGKILTSLELNINQDHWKIIDSYTFTPVSSKINVLQFPKIDVRANENELPIDVFTNKSVTFVFIKIGDSDEENSTWQQISNQCIVVFKDNYLQGFLINLPQN